MIQRKGSKKHSQEVRIELAAPVILRSQIPDISYATGMKQEDIEKVLFDGFGIAKETNLKKGLINKYHVYSTKTIPVRYETGSEGIIWLCKEYDYNVNYLTSVIIDKSLFAKTNKIQQDDLLYLCKMITSRNDRLQQMLDMKAPDALTIELKHGLTQAVNYLQDNNINHPVTKFGDDSGRPLCSLTDFGYSLLSESKNKKNKKEESLTEKYQKLKEENAVLSKELEKYKKDHEEVERLKEKIQKVQKERDKTVKELNTTILKLEHRLDEIVEQNKNNTFNN